MIDTVAFWIAALRSDFSAYCSHHLKDYGLTKSLLFHLIFVGKSPGCTLSQLSTGLYSDPGHTTRVVEKLTQKGYLVRTQSTEDRRVFTLRLTPEGEAVFAQARSWFYDWEKERFSHLSKQELTTLKQLLQKAWNGSSSNRCRPRFAHDHQEGVSP